MDLNHVYNQGINNLKKEEKDGREIKIKMERDDDSASVNLIEFDKV